jgi:hypothetical protein
VAEVAPVSPVEVWIDCATLVLSWWMWCGASGYLVGWKLGGFRLPAPVVLGAIAVLGAANGAGAWLLSTWWLGRYLQ